MGTDDNGYELSICHQLGKGQNPVPAPVFQPIHPQLYDRLSRAERPIVEAKNATCCYVSNGKQSGPRIGKEKGPLTGGGAGLSR
jgi:hypothetical protein